MCSKNTLLKALAAAGNKPGCWLPAQRSRGGAQRATLPVPTPFYFGKNQMPHHHHHQGSLPKGGVVLSQETLAGECLGTEASLTHSLTQQHTGRANLHVPGTVLGIGHSPEDGPERCRKQPDFVWLCSAVYKPDTMGDASSHCMMGTGFPCWEDALRSVVGT